MKQFVITIMICGILISGFSLPANLAAQATSVLEGKFESNNSLDSVIHHAARRNWRTTGLLKRLKIYRALRDPDLRYELELALTETAAEAGAIPPEARDQTTGVYVGDWQDLFQWFLDNWPAILEMIMQIISLFNQPTLAPVGYMSPPVDAPLVLAA